MKRFWLYFCAAFVLAAITIQTPIGVDAAAPGVALVQTAIGQIPDPSPIPEPETQLTGVAALWPDRDGLLRTMQRNPDRVLESIETVIGGLSQANQQNAVTAIWRHTFSKTGAVSPDEAASAEKPTAELERIWGQATITKVDGRVQITFDPGGK